MSRKIQEPETSPPESTTAAEDQELILRVKRGDDGALRCLMDRYDRLVRFTVYRLSGKQCLRDPQWLDSVASQTWFGVTQTFRSMTEPRISNLPSYLGLVARNQTVTSLRKLKRQKMEITGAESIERITESSDSFDPVEIEAKIELLEILQNCIGSLSSEERLMLSQVARLLDQKWTEAAKLLITKESTLRSRWPKALDRLQRCVERKAGVRFARRPISDD